MLPPPPPLLADDDDDGEDIGSAADAADEARALRRSSSGPPLTPLLSNKGFSTGWPSLSAGTSSFAPDNFLFAEARRVDMMSPLSRDDCRRCGDGWGVGNEAMGSSNRRPMLDEDTDDEDDDDDDDESG